jgi:hypothetical protein
MRHKHLLFALISVLLLAVFVAACSTPTEAVPIEEVSEPTRAPTEEPESSPELTPTVDFASQLEDVYAAAFDNPTQIENEWMPLEPGMQYIYEGVTEDAGEVNEHRVIITVTDLVKEIDGIQTVVSWDEDYSGGALVETELAFYAQDNDGNVWRMGEYPEVYENNKLVEAPAWISGLKGAQAGIMMAADPGMEERSFSQGWGPAVGFTDRWQVDRFEEENCVPLECYENVLVTAEYSEEEPDAFQLKFYASGIGNVRVGWIGLDATREELELVEIVRLTPEQMEAAREAALELEARAYEISKEVYDQTPPSVVQ